MILPPLVIALFKGYPTFLEIPGPPHAQQRPRVVRGGAYKPDSARERAVAWQIKAQWPGGALEGPVAVFARFWMADARRRDLDNFCKGILDSATKAGIWHDDTQVSVLVALKGIDRENPRTEVAIGEAAEMDSTKEVRQWKSL